MTVAATFGGGEACEVAILPIERLLVKEIRHLRATKYLDGIERFELWLRVAGTMWEAKSKSGPSRLATGRNPPRIIVDLVIAKEDYLNRDIESVRETFARGVEACFELMLARALKKNAVREEGLLRIDFAMAMVRFRSEIIPPYVPLGTPQYV
jgi:hypothetical protein